MAESGPKSRLRAVWQSVLADHDRNMRELQLDLKELSQFAMNKVRDLQDQRRMKRQQAASNFDLWEGVNQGVGCNILSHYKHDWAAIHHSTSASSQQAGELYSSILSLQHSMSQAHSIVSNACEELSQLPAIIKSVEESKGKVDKIRELLHGVEEGLEEYVRSAAMLERDRKKHSARIQFNQHKEKREAELQKWVDTVASEKRKTLERQEMLEQLAQRERQETFDSIFTQQMAEFKEKGEVDRPIVSEETRQRGDSQLSLEQVEIDDNAGEEQLKEFLSDVQEGEREEEEGEKKEEEED